MRWPSRATALRHSLFIGVNLGLAGLVGALVMIPIADRWHDQSLRLAEARRQFAEFDAVSRQETATRVAFGTENDPIVSAMLPEGDEGASEAALMGHLRSRIEPSGARIAAIRGLGPSTIEGVTVLGVHVDLAGSNAGIAQALAAIERGTPMIVIEDAALRSTAPPSAQSPEAEPDIEARLDLYAPWQRGKDAR